MLGETLFTPVVTLPNRTSVRAIIQCAMKEEVEPFLRVLANQHSKFLIGDARSHQQKFISGQLNGSAVLIVESGIGLVNAACAISRALMLVEPKLVIAAGTMGGLHTDVEVGDIIAGISAKYHNADATAFGYQIGQIPQMPVEYQSNIEIIEQVNLMFSQVSRPLWVGQVVSADSFVTAANVKPVRKQFPEALGTDMETCAIAQVCYGLAMPWVSLRAVSDLCGPKADQDFHIAASKAAEYSCEAVRLFLD